MNKMDELRNWVKTDLCRFVNFDEAVEDVAGHGNNEETKWVFALYTDNYVYRFVALDKYDHPGYLGCQVSSRKPRAGEDWTRGRDLPDGHFNRKTWEKIKNDMLGFELVQLAKRTNEAAIEGLKAMKQLEESVCSC